jgi:hypothetical protein
MHAPLSELVHLWHDFYVLLGTAAATLVGLMFVTATIGANMFTEANREAMRAFLSPTVAHFSAVLFICVLAIIPMENWTSFALLLAVCAVVGLVHSARVWLQLFVRGTFKVDVVDRLFYALIPVIGYVLVLVSAVLLFMHWGSGLTLLAAALMTLLLAGIRNAWDMTTFIVIRTPAVGSSPAERGGVGDDGEDRAAALDRNPEQPHIGRQ